MTNTTFEEDVEQKINSANTNPTLKQDLQHISRFRIIFGLLIISLIAFEFYFYYYGTRSLSEDLSLLGNSSKETATTTAVKTAFLVHKRLADNSISVTTSNGVVTLKGNVNWLVDKIIAEEVARNIRGVQSVINYITVLPNQKDEQHIKDLSSENEDLKTQSAVFEALLASKELNGQQIRVSVDSQIVTLDGCISTEEQKELVIKTVLSTPGVKAIKAENLMVIPKFIRI